MNRRNPTGEDRHPNGERVSMSLLLVLLWIGLCGTPLRSQEAREIWIPANRLEAVIKDKPRAVFLTPAQYKALVLDAYKAVFVAERESIDPPLEATVRSVRMSGEIRPGAGVVPVTATYEVESFSDDWAEVPLVLPLAHLGHIEVDDESALRTTDSGHPMLLIHGKGVRRIKAVFHLPVQRTPAGDSIEIHSQGIAAAHLSLTLPEGTRLRSLLPFHASGTRAECTIPARSHERFPVTWSARRVSPISGAAIFQTCSYLYNIDSARLQADLGLVLNSSLAELPSAFTIDLPPDVRVVSVDGSEILGWNRETSGALRVTLLPAERDAADIRLRVERDIPENAVSGELSLDLPIARVRDVHRASGTMTIIGSDDVRVRQILTGPLTVPVPDDVEMPAAALPNHVASFQFPVQNEAPSLSISRVLDRFNAQADTLITLNREAVFLNRTLSFLPLEGRIFQIDAVLPPGEELVEVTSPGREDFEWTRENGNLAFRWNGSLSPDDPARVEIASRRDPENWYSLGEEAMTLAFQPIVIEGTEAVSGYVAVSFDPSFRVETGATDGLEPRDGRTTPVTGNLAWFRLEDYSLELEPSRRRPELEASLVAYALPLANSLEIEGEIQLDILHSGIRELRIGADPGVSPFLRFESPSIAQQHRDEESGDWTLTFHQELDGVRNLRFSVNLPLEVTGGEGSDSEKRFQIPLPRLTIPGAKRLRGDWIIEANTDTELTFAAEGLDEVDSLRVPEIRGYRPRHRIIAAYQYRGEEWSLELSGIRHPHSDLVTTVIDLLEIDTVVSTDGTDRHRARLTVRSSGDQFLELEMPPRSVLWSLAVDGRREKPVRSGRDMLRVQLPAHENPDQAIEIRVIYSTPGRNWGGSGRERLTPVRVSEAIPVMRSFWRLHLPEGFDYQRFRSNLRQGFEIEERLLMGQVFRELGSREARRTDLATLGIEKTETTEESIDELITRAANGQVQGGRQSGVFSQTVEPEAAGGAVPAEAAGRAVRLQEEVRQADVAALRGSQLLADKDREGALEQFRNAIELLPDAPLTARRKRAYVSQFSRAASDLARHYADNGRFAEAIAQIEEVLQPGIDPDNADARRLLEQLEDPEYYSPALTPAHLERVRRVQLALKTAQGYLDYGDWARADREYRKVLDIDRYRSAARRNLEDMERGRTNYFDVARDQTRSSFHLQIGQGWEMPVPASTATAEILRNEEKLKSIRIPSVEFRETPLRDALQFLRQKSVELDTRETDPAKKGINLVLGGLSDGVGDTPITLRLTNVPLGEALRYTTNLAQLKYKVESHAVLVVPLSTPDADLFTNQYIVPPTFLMSGTGSGGAAVADPFAPAQDTNQPVTRQTARNILESAGITFGPGSTAIYNPSTSTLIIKNTPDQMELVEAYIESIKAGVDPDIGPPITRTPILSVDEGGRMAAIRETEEKLRNIRIPSIRFDEMPLEDALEVLEQQAGVTVDLAAKVPPASPDGFGFEGAQAANAPENGKPPGERPITLQLSDVPLVEALRYTANLAGLTYQVDAGGVKIVSPSEAGEPKVAFRYQLPPGTYDSLMGLHDRGTGQQAETEVADPFASAPTPPPPTNPREMFERAGITFGPDADANYDPATGELTVKNSPDQIELVEAFLSSLNGGMPVIETRALEPAIDSLPVTEAAAAGTGASYPVIEDLDDIGNLFASVEESIGNNRERLSSTELENLDLREKTVGEAVDLLKKKMDEAAGAQAAAPLSIELETDADSGTKLDFTMEKTTALEAVERIAGASNSRYIVTRSGVVIADRSAELEPMEMVFLPLPPRLFQSIGDDGSIRRIHARNVLQVNGIKFPRGSSAAYNPSTGRLAVRNTRKNLEAIVSHFAADMEALAQNPNAPENDLRFSRDFLGGAADLRGFRLEDIGRLPIDFDLPESGRVYQFDGLYAPGELRFRYVNWERQIRAAWFWIAAGLAVFLLYAWRQVNQPLFLGLAGVVVLSFLPAVLGTGVAAFCNSLLIGWLLGLAVWIVYRIGSALAGPAGLALLAGLLGIPAVAGDGDPDLVKKHTVYIPYDPGKPVSERKAERYYLDYETFQGLWKQAKVMRQARHRDAKPDETVSGHTLTTALYRIISSPNRLEVRGRLTITTRGREWQKVPLPFRGIHLSEILIDDSPASFQNGALLIEKTGKHLVEVAFELPMEEGKDTVSFSIPKSTGVLLEIEMNDDLAEPVLQGNWPLARKTGEDGKTLYTAAIGQQQKIEFRRRLETSGRGLTRPNSAVIDARLFVAQGLEQMEATYRLQFEGQEEDRFTIRFEDSLTPVRFDIPNLSVWEVRNRDDAPLRELTFTLTQPVRDSITVRFTGERAPESDSRSFPRLGADATRTEQRRTLLRAEGLRIKPDPGPRHRQIPEPESARSSGFHPVAAYSLTGANEDLRYQSSEKRAERSAGASYVFQVGSDKLETIGQFQIRSPEEPLLDLTVTLPAEAKVQSVRGNRIKDWWRTGDDLFIRFSGDTPEVTAVLIYVTRTIEESAEAMLPVTPFFLKEFEEEEVTGSGLIVAHVTRETGLSFEQDRNVIREVGVDEVAGDFEVLSPLERKRGFRFERMTFSGDISLSTIEPKFDALWVMLARVHESWVRLSVHADLEVTRSGLDRFTFETDASVPEFRILSDDVREVRTTEADGVRRYEVSFQQIVTDALSFTMETEIAHGGEVSLPDLSVPGANRQERFLIVENQSAERMDLSAENVDTTVESLLPYKPETLTSAKLFRARPGWRVNVELENLQTSAGNEAVILYAELTTAFRASGEEWLRAVYHIQNRSLQFLPVALPGDAELVSVVVAGSEVRADRGSIDERDVVLVPLIQTKPGQLAYDVELVVRSRGSGGTPARKLRRRLDDPAVFGPTIEKTIWKVHLPAGHSLLGAGGNMEPIDEEESTLRKLQSDIAELKSLNWLGSQKSEDYRTRNDSTGNAEILAGRIERELDRLSREKQQLMSRREKRDQVKELAQLQEELSTQKAVITENRIELPLFQQQRQEDGPAPAEEREGADTRKQKIVWGDNSGKIVARNREKSRQSVDQIARVESQFRLNDNISLGNEFFGAQPLEEKEARKKEVPQEKSNRYSQIGKLSENAKAREVDQKLSILNNSQAMDQKAAAQKPLSQTPAQREPEQQKKKDTSLKARLFSNARSRLDGKKAAQDRSAPDQPSPPPASRPQSGLDIQRQELMRAGAAITAPVAPVFGRALQAQGRRPVTVDFPVEGPAHYFEKLKDHAELRVVSGVTGKSGNFSALLGMILSLGLLGLLKFGLEKFREHRLEDA